MKLHLLRSGPRSEKNSRTLTQPFSAKRAINSLTSLFISACMVIPLLNVSAGAETIPARPAHNTEVRHGADCTALSAAALDYYTGEYSYETISALPGAVDISDSYSAM